MPFPYPSPYGPGPHFGPMVFFAPAWPPGVAPGWAPPPGPAAPAPAAGWPSPAAYIPWSGYGPMGVPPGASYPAANGTAPRVTAPPSSQGSTEPMTMRAGPRPENIIRLEAAVLGKNDALARDNRAELARRNVAALNVMSSPGSGKTTLLVRTIQDLASKLPFYVLEGDQETAFDAERIRATGVRALQINTGKGCHLEADMVAQGLKTLDPQQGILLIENVGNLVCPALFDLGESARVVLFSVTEGEDKPRKYPHMFQAADVVLVTKTDLIPHLDFDRRKALGFVQELAPDAEIIELSARTGEGLSDWYAYLRQILPASST